MIFIVVKFYVRPEHTESFLDHVAPLTEATRAEPGNTKMIDAIDRMKVEDDRLTKRLQGICRGC